MSVIPALRRLRQKNHKFKYSLGYMTRPCQERKEGRYGGRKEGVQTELMNSRSFQAP
jgi:hypothetical protein